MLESYHKLQPKPRTVPEFKEAIQLIVSALLEKVIDNAVKDYRKQLQACVSANGGHFEYTVFPEKKRPKCFWEYLRQTSGDSHEI